MPHSLTLVPDGQRGQEVPSGVREAALGQGAGCHVHGRAAFPAEAARVGHIANAMRSSPVQGTAAVTAASPPPAWPVHGALAECFLSL